MDGPHPAPDEHHVVEQPPVGAPAAVAAPDLAMLERVERELADVESVLPTLDDGTYGTCETCGSPIADERLAAQPATRWCAAHLTRH